MPQVVANETKDLTMIGQAKIVQVLVPRAVPTVLDYKVQGPAEIGDWVEVPIGKGSGCGMVVATLEHSAFQSLKLATARRDVPRMHAKTIDFLRFVARYNLTAPGEPLRAGLVKGKVPPVPKKALELLDFGQSDLADLTAEQVASARQIAAAKQFQPFLLDGVTGSGKTEVYFHVLAEVLRQDAAQTLVLLPEIALTVQWLQRFEAAFGIKPLVWHAHITPVQRARVWWRVINGERCVVVGARSALFLPWQNLKQVVVDEEHDPSYKQSDGMRYHGRDMAVALAKVWDCPVVLASATPSLETWAHALDGKYTHLKLPERYSKQVLPQVKLVDLRQEKLETDVTLAGVSAAAIEATLARGEQALLFLNRRGNAPLLLCTSCGYRRDCSRCSASMTVHGDKLLCHHCGLQEDWPETCPSCGEENSWRAYGPGTRSLFLEAQQRFPQAKIAVADSDALSTPKQQRVLVEQMAAGEINILIATQMMAKGQHFPNLTLVVVMDGDMGLAVGDVRAAEKTFQNLIQVAGRAGREKPGQVLVQTYQPEAGLFQALKTYDRDAFYGEEAENRKLWGDPPFGRQVAVIVRGKDEKQVQQMAQVLVRQAPQVRGIELLGPAPAPMVKVRDVYRWRILVKGTGLLQAYVKGWVEAVAVPSSVRVDVDVDPQSFL